MNSICGGWPSAAKDRVRQIKERSRASTAQIEDPARERPLHQIQQHAHHVVDEHKVARLMSVRDAVAMTLEQPHAAPRPNLIERLDHDAGHRPLCRSPNP
jgi:hypothetical protein